MERIKADEKEQRKYVVQFGDEEEGVTMIHKVKIQLIGRALGAILPEDLLENMHVGQDDELLVVPYEFG